MAAKNRNEDEVASVSRLQDAFAHDELYRKLHTHRNDHEREGQFVDHQSILHFKGSENEEYCRNAALMPIDIELMYEVGRAVRSEVQQQIAYANYILHEAVVAPLNVVGISMSELGSLEPPPDWQMLDYPSGEGTSYARPRGEGDDPIGVDDDHLPHSS
ncbi:hypothetical protein M9H77_09627 [Catharanthus roseus]|uniref:Uncharacterized protein n=1 Tax=Catharanthus roseus TaxID=4058 RepID=A0ACC0C1A6_CATRO|nr:hypothetical protein M9H77_09627 [Catharanthus roseus]